MHPVLFSFWRFEFHTYTVLMAGAFLLGVFLFFRENDRRPEPFAVTPIGALVLFLGILIGSKVWYMIFYEPPKSLGEALRFWEGGFVSFGGMLGGGVGACLYLWYCGAPVLPVSDLVLRYVPLCHAVGRLGCFFNGCCYGRPASVPWAVEYPAGTAIHEHLCRLHARLGLIAADATNHCPVHPTQLYEVFGLLVVFGFVWFLYPRRRFDGALLVLYPGLYGLMRFVVEFFRGDVAGSVGFLRTPQVVGLTLAASSFAIYAILRTIVRRRETRPPDEKGIDPNAL